MRPWVAGSPGVRHSGTPDLGENAIYQAARFVAMVEAINRSVVAVARTRWSGNESDDYARQRRRCRTSFARPVWTFS